MEGRGDMEVVTRMKRCCRVSSHRGPHTSGMGDGGGGYGGTGSRGGVVLDRFIHRRQGAVWPVGRPQALEVPLGTA